MRVPYADGTLYPIPAGEDDALLPSLLTLSDVMRDRPSRGRHRQGRCRPRVAVVGDGHGGHAGSSRRSGSAPSRSSSRAATPTGSRSPEFGATDVVGERGEEAVERVKELTGDHGAHSVLETAPSDAMRTAVEIARPGGAVGRVGVPHYEAIPAAEPAFFGNITVGGGPAPARAYLDELLPDVLEGRIEPGRVFDRVVALDEVPDGYRAMNEREALKVMVNPS